MKRKLVSMILIAVICMTNGFFGVAEAAVTASGSCGDALTWEFDSDAGTLTIIGSGEMDDYDYDWNIPVPWIDLRDHITSLILPDGLTGIGKRAFASLTEITEVKVPDSVSRIGAGRSMAAASLLLSSSRPGQSSLASRCFTPVKHSRASPCLLL